MTNYLDIIEAAYDLESDPSEWFARLRRVALESLELRWGMVYGYHLDRHEGLQVQPGLLGPFSSDQIRQTIGLMPAKLARKVLGTTRAEARLYSSSFSDQVAAKNPLFEQVLPSLGLKDMLTLHCPQDHQNGVTLTFGFQNDPTLRRPTMEKLECVADHIATAYRLRQRIAQLEEQDETRWDGGADRRALRRDLRALIRAGNVRRATETEAQAAWRGLVEGRWSVVANHSAANESMILARRIQADNEDDPSALTVAERRVLELAADGRQHKFIAYELDMAQSTASKHFTAGMRKLGLQSRRELCELFANLAQAKDDER